MPNDNDFWNFIQATCEDPILGLQQICQIWTVKRFHPGLSVERQDFWDAIPEEIIEKIDKFDPRISDILVYIFDEYFFLGWYDQRFVHEEPHSQKFKRIDSRRTKNYPKTTQGLFHAAVEMNEILENLQSKMIFNLDFQGNVEVKFED